jgi:phosphoserine aminotransferase
VSWKSGEAHEPQGEILLSLGGYGSLPWLQTASENAEALLLIQAPLYSDIEIVITNLQIDKMTAVTTEEDHYLVFTGNSTTDGDWNLGTGLSLA